MVTCRVKQNDDGITGQRSRRRENQKQQPAIGVVVPVVGCQQAYNYSLPSPFTLLLTNQELSPILLTSIYATSHLRSIHNADVHTIGAFGRCGRQP